MGCVGGKQGNQKQLDKAGSAPKAQPAVAPPVNSQVQSGVKEQDPKPLEKLPSEHQDSRLQHPKSNAAPAEEVNSNKAFSGIKNTSNIAKSDVHESQVKANQSSIHGTNHRADVPVIDVRSGIIHNSPAEVGSNVEGTVQEIKSYVDSGIARSQNQARSLIYNKQKSLLANIAEEEDEKVHDEGVNSFAIPIKNINLHVEVK